MNTAITFKHWMQHFHGGGARVAHYAGHMLHEKAFWIILAFVLLTAGLFTLIALFGQDATLHEYYRMPMSPLIH